MHSADLYSTQSYYHYLLYELEWFMGISTSEKNLITTGEK